MKAKKISKDTRRRCLDFLVAHHISYNCGALTREYLPKSEALAKYDDKEKKLCLLAWDLLRADDDWGDCKSHIKDLEQYTDELFRLENLTTSRDAYFLLYDKRFEVEQEIEEAYDKVEKLEDDMLGMEMDFDFYTGHVEKWMRL